MIANVRGRSVLDAHARERIAVALEEDARRTAAAARRVRHDYWTA